MMTDKSYPWIFQLFNFSENIERYRKIIQQRIVAVNDEANRKYGNLVESIPLRLEKMIEKQKSEETEEDEDCDWRRRLFAQTFSFDVFFFRNLHRSFLKLFPADNKISRQLNLKKKRRQNLNFIFIRSLSLRDSLRTHLRFTNIVPKSRNEPCVQLTIDERLWVALERGIDFSSPHLLERCT